jgi:hypothetical protein
MPADPFNAHLAAQQRATFADSLVTDFGDAAGERAALARDRTVHPLTADGLIRVTGTAARTFLQGQLSNDLYDLDRSRAQLTTWCSAQGRMLASFLAWRDGDAYLLQLPRELLAATRGRLARFVLRADVALVEATADLVLIGLGGPRADEVLASVLPQPPSAPMEMSEDSAGTRAIMLAADLYQLAVQADRAVSVWQALARSARPAGTLGWDWRRIRACLPTITTPTQDKFVPQMADMERIGAVSFTKGCYPGQEVVARAQYRGQVKRRLFRIEAASGALAPGQELAAADGTPAGSVVNAAPAPSGGSEALAVLQIEAAAGALRAGDAAVRVLGSCH